MLSKGIIRPSSSPWPSPVVLVTAKKGAVHFRVDYWRINKFTRKDVYPMPRLHHTPDALRRARYFSSVRLWSGYWQIPMADEDKDKTAFVTPDELFDCNVTPFGLSNAPATFERLMNILLRGLREKICLCLFDYVVVY